MSAVPGMSLPSREACRPHYDVVIVGGAIMGSALAWFLMDNPDFDGSVLVVERDVSYTQCSTAHTNSCIRQQFSDALNVRISQFGVEYIKHFRERLGNDERVPPVALASFGYLYLASDPQFAAELARRQALQRSLGVGTRLLDQAQLRRQFSGVNFDDIELGSWNPVDEGYFDGTMLFEWWRRKARERGVEYIQAEVIALDVENSRIVSARTDQGQRIEAGLLVNAAGPRAATLARMAGVALPVEPRKRYTWVFETPEPLPCELPLVIDPSGVHVHPDGRYYMAGSAAPGPDKAVDADDFSMSASVWEDHAWPALAARIPAFESLRVVNSWAGHYAYNVFDQNAIVGAHDVLENFLFINGFSGHGLQQSPAMGRALAEWISYGEYRTLDMTPLAFARIRQGAAVAENAVI